MSEIRNGDVLPLEFMARRERADGGDLTWYDYPGYEDRYEITKCGRVRSKTRYVNSPAAGGKRLVKGKELKLSLVKGYYALQVALLGKRRTEYIHRAIATLFVDNPLMKPHVNHIDGNKINNNPDNLEWCTHLENMRHAYRTGLAHVRESGPGEKSPAAKLCDDDVREIKRRLLIGETQASIAKRFGMSKGAIGFIARGETWSHVEV